MKVLKFSSLTTLITTVVLAQPSSAATLSLSEQVLAAAEFFTGFFDNSAQVTGDPTIPALTMQNCAISSAGNGNSAAQYLHLEQYIGGSTLLRTATYEFSPGTTNLNLSVYGYLDDAQAVGTCDQATPIVDFSNLEVTSCDISLLYEPEQFVGSNAPGGCATSFPVPGSTVVSTVAIRADGTDSLDEFFTPFGTSFGTPIEFRRVVATPEPLSSIALLGIGLVGFISTAKKERQ